MIATLVLIYSLAECARPLVLMDHMVPSEYVDHVMMNKLRVATRKERSLGELDLLWLEVMDRIDADDQQFRTIRCDN